MLTQVQSNVNKAVKLENLEKFLLTDQQMDLHCGFLSRFIANKRSLRPRGFTGVYLKPKEILKKRKFENKELVTH